MDRRVFVESTTLTALMPYARRWTREPASALDPHQDGRRIGADTLTGIEASIDTFRHLDAQMGGGALLDAAIPQLALIHRLLSRASYDETTGRRLYQAAADLSGLIGWFLIDIGRPRAAAGYLAAALRASHTANDPVIGAQAVSFMAIHEYSTGDPRYAARLAATARDRLRHHASPMVEAMLLTRQARGHAKAGDARAAWRALGHAFDRYARGPSDQDPTWLYWMTDGEMHGQAGAIALERGDNARAAEYFQRAHDSYDELCARDRATCLIRTGTALLRLGEPDHGYAQALAGLAIADRIESTRLADQVTRFDTDLSLHAPERLRREFTERAARYLRPVH